MGVHGSKSQKNVVAGQRRPSETLSTTIETQPRLSVKKPTSITNEEVKKPFITSKVKVWKQKLLESHPQRTVITTSHNSRDIKKALKEDATADKTPFYKPHLPKPEPIDVPLKQLKVTFGIPSSVDKKAKKKVKVIDPLLQSDDQNLDGDKPSEQTQKSVRKRRSVHLSSSLRKPVPKEFKSYGNRKPRKDNRSPAVLKKNSIVKSKEVSPTSQGVSPRSSLTDLEAENLIIKQRKLRRKSHITRLMVGHFGHSIRTVMKFKERQDDEVKPFLQGDKGIGLQDGKMLDIGEGGDLNRLKLFGIPDQRQLLTTALDTDTCEYDFGGNLRYYYSSVLRNYIPNNMLERYRGAPPFSPCLSAVDIKRFKGEFSGKGKTKEDGRSRYHLE